jgi:hypothetical protein
MKTKMLTYIYVNYLISRGLAQPEKPDTDELDDILTAMGILDSEDGTINTRLARYLCIYILVKI